MTREGPAPGPAAHWRRLPWWAVGLAALGLAALAPAGSAAAQATAGRDLPATADGREGHFGHNSPGLAVDPTDPMMVALASRLDEPDYGCALQLSGDGGRGWLTADPVPALPAGAQKCYAPEVAFGPDGTVHYLFVGLAGPANRPIGAFLTTSTDRGRTFGVPRPVLGPNAYHVRMAVDRSVGRSGRIHLAWVQAASEPRGASMPEGPNPILAAHSDDGGATFSDPVAVSGAGRPRAMAPALAVGRDRTVHVVYYDMGDDRLDYQGLEGATYDGHWSVVAATSTDGGATFREVVVEASVIPPGPVLLIFTMAPPAVAADRSGRVYAAWTDGRGPHPAVMAARSADGGRTWSGPSPVTPGASARQDLPALAAGPRGRLDVIFYDRGHDSRGLTSHAYYARSDDGGRSFGSPLRLSSKPSDTRVGKTYPFPRAAGLADPGSRLGLAVGGRGPVAAWTDTRNSVDPRQQDIFSAVVTLPGDEAGPGRGLLLAAAVVAAGGIGLSVRGVARFRRRRARGVAGAGAVPA